MLKVIDLHVHYGGITALRGINLTIKENQIVTLIGANGAGKSSTLRAIMGLVKSPKGRSSTKARTSRAGPPRISSPKESPWCRKGEGCLPI